MWFHEVISSKLKKEVHGHRGRTLSLRFFLFLVCFILIIICVLLLILNIIGVFDRDKNQCNMILENEVNHLEQDIATDLSELTLKGVDMAEQITASMDHMFKKHHIHPKNLSEHPELLEDLISEQISLLLATMENQQCSGIYIMLNATINPTNPNAETSKYGVFLKQTEPSSIAAISSKIYYLRGAANIARKNKIELLAQWKFEFDTSEETFFQYVMDTTCDNIDLSLSRLYYWTPRILLKGNSEAGMLLCIPLIGVDDTVYGVCGFEISTMLFKLRYSPDNRIYPRIFSVLAPSDTNHVYMAEGLLAGNSYLNSSLVGRTTTMYGGKKFYTSYGQDDGEVYCGKHKSIGLYPSDSPYANNLWFVGVMMPEEDINIVVGNMNLRLTLSMIGILMISIVAAVFISKKCVAPVTETIENIREENDISKVPKTKYLEINDLIEFLTAQDNEKEVLYAQQLQEEVDKAKFEMEETYKQKAEMEEFEKGKIELENEKKEVSATESKLLTSEITPNTLKQPMTEIPTPNLSLYNEFVKNISTLSAAERLVFDLYMKGHTAQEISQILFLSMNTIKTHNKHIYMKLNVSSRKELMIYVQMMAKECVY